MSLAPSLTQTSPVHQGRAGHIALWIVQIALAAMFLLAGSSKLFGALALVATMIGAIAAHLFIVGGSPAMPVILLFGSAGVLWARRNQLLGALRTVR